MVYTLSGPDAASFRVRQDDAATPDEDENEGGQIEVAAGAKLDYETKQTYMMTLTATDSFGDSASIMVTIMVTDVDEPPAISEGGLAISGMTSVDYAENETGMVATYSATGPESASASWSLGGDDAGDFRISNSGVLTFRSAPDHENAADADMDNVYMVTVMADDGTYMDTHNVVVTVTDVVEEVPTSGTLLERYDVDVNGLDKSEVLKAINDYLFGEGDAAITKTDVLSLINLYLFG